MLLSAVLLGVSITAVRVYPPFASPPRLGASLDRTDINPLTDRYVDQILGPGDRSATSEVAGNDARPRTGAPDPDDAAGQVVQHAFTNDDQADAYPIERLPFTGRTSTAAAGRETGEPECGTQLGGTVWYRYTATRSEALLADTFGTQYQTSLAAYRRTSGRLQQMEHGCALDSRGNSQIRVTVVSGTTYLFQVGAAVQGGSLTFHLKRFGETILASVSSAGRVGNASSSEPAVSSDGRFVAFASNATNLIRGMEARKCRQVGPGPLPMAPCANVFLRDRRSGMTRLVSVALNGRPANDMSEYPQVSDDGRYVLFHSRASDLVAGDTNGIFDAFVRDMRTGRTERVSLSDRDEQVPSAPVSSARDAWGNAGVRRSAMSADGRFIAFESRSANLAAGDTDEFRDVFLRDRRLGTTRVVSLDAGGKRSPNGVTLESMSRDGRWLLLGTDVSMTEQDDDLLRDFYLRDLRTGATELVSVAEAGHDGEDRDAATGYDVSQRSISDDGRFVAFGSDGALVEGDTNGVMDVFVRDRVRKTTERVSVSSSGGEGAGTVTTDPNNSAGAIPGWSISGDGRTVAFTTDLGGLDPADQNQWSDVFVHDRVHQVTLLLSTSVHVPGNGDEPGSYTPRLSSDGMHTAFASGHPISNRDSNRRFDVFVFSPLPAIENAGPPAKLLIPAGPCPASPRYERVGLSGAHENVTPSPIPDHGIEWMLYGLDGPYYYSEQSTVRFRYRIDLSGSSKVPRARVADIAVELRWDNVSDYDLWVYDADGELLGGLNGGPGNYNNGNLTKGDLRGIETEVLDQVPHCTDLRVDVVNFNGVPPNEMTLDVTIGGVS